jgi:hypothetical protein
MNKFKEHIAEEETLAEELQAIDESEATPAEEEVVAEETTEEVVADEVVAEETTEEVSEEAEDLEEAKSTKSEEEEMDSEEDDMEDEEDEEDDMEESSYAKKKMKKEEVEVDMSEDVDAMLSGQDLSEDFKAKATTIFEAAVVAKVKDVEEQLHEKYEAQLAEQVETVKEELAEKVDGYLDYVIESWMQENEIAIEKGIHAELVEDFMSGLKNLFVEHYIDIPEEKVDVLEEQSSKIDDLEAKLNEEFERGVEMKKELDGFKAQAVLGDICEGLAETEKSKIAKLAEGVEFVDADQYREKLETIKESYYPARVKATGNPEDGTAQPLAEQQEMSGTMAAYLKATTRSLK